MRYLRRLSMAWVVAAGPVLTGQSGRYPVRRWGRAFTRHATSIAQCAASMLDQSTAAFMPGGDASGHDGLVKTRDLAFDGRYESSTENR